MIHTLKNNTFRLLAGLVLGTLIVTFISVQYNNKHPQQAMNYSDTINLSTSLCPKQFLNHADTLMTTTWEQLETNAGITQDDCEQFLDEYGHEIKDDIEKSVRRKAKKLPKISQETLGLLHEILIDCQIDPRSITIAPFKGDGSPAAADDYTLYIDEADFATFCPQTQRFLIAHELAHMHYKDHSIESAIESLMDTKTSAHRKAMCCFAHSTEFRADIHAMLKGPEYARGGILFFQTLIDRYGDGKSSTHPRPSERLRIAQEMEAMHGQQEQQLLPIGVVAA